MRVIGKFIFFGLFIFSTQLEIFAQIKTVQDSYVNLAKTSQNPCTDTKYLELEQNWKLNANLNGDDYVYYISFLSECKRRKPASKTPSMSKETVGCLETLLCPFFPMGCW